MIEIRHTSVADSAVFSTEWSEAFATVAQSREYHVSFLPFVVVWDLKHNFTIH